MSIFHNFANRTTDLIFRLEYGIYSVISERHVYLKIRQRQIKKPTKSVRILVAIRAIKDQTLVSQLKLTKSIINVNILGSFTVWNTESQVHDGRLTT